MARQHVGEIPSIWPEIRPEDLPEGLADLLADYIQRQIETCEMCSAAGKVTLATKCILGRDVCPECAAALADSLQIGPAIWMVDVRNPWPDTDPVADDPVADYGTVDHGD